MPEPLVCEDTSLTRLLETVHNVPGARILYQDTVRRGGVLGFFAREVHRVAYLPGEVDSSPASALAALSANPVDVLLLAAEEAEDRLQRSGPADFASVLAEYVTAEADHPAELPEPEAADEPAAEPMPELAAVTPLAGRGRESRGRLELLMQLRQIGVPVSMNPAAGVSGAYEALEDVLAQLPAPAELPSAAGQVLVIVGDGAPALRAARTVSKMLRLKVSSIVAAGMEGRVAGGTRRISSPDEAAQVRTELAAASTPSVVVIATDGAGLGPDDPWPAAMLAALRPATVWAVVDARWKTEDSQAYLAALPRAEALVVHSAEHSVSPATVWELELPVALLDDRRPSPFIWLGMLTALIGGAARHRATA